MRQEGGWGRKTHNARNQILFLQQLIKLSVVCVGSLRFKVQVRHLQQSYEKTVKIILENYFRKYIR